MHVGRPRNFDEDEALDKAMRLFWSQGYESAGLSKLTAAMGISRQSLYDTFGSKRSLFIRSIMRYRDTQLAAGLALLERPGSAIGNVKELVRFFERLASDEECCGCLVANAVVEVAPHDPEIAELLGETLEILRKSIYDALKRAQDAQELGSEKSPRQLSRAITNAMIGLAVSGKLDMSRAALRDVYAGTLSMLD